MSKQNLALVFNNTYADTVTKNFKSFLDGDLYIDLIFVCRNNKKVGAHQIVMGCISKFFYSMFLENLNTVREKVIHVYVPDIRAKIMKRILDFVYCGKAKLSKTELSEFNEDIKLLGMPLDVFTSSNETSQMGTGERNVPAFTNPSPVTSVKSGCSNASSATSGTANESVISSSNINTLDPNTNESVISCESENSNDTSVKSGCSNVPSATFGVPNESVISSSNINTLDPNTNESVISSSNTSVPVPVLRNPNESVISHRIMPSHGGKRRKLSGLQASEFVNLDSDEEKNDDVITLT